jgi:hypothetical protein
MMRTSNNLEKERGKKVHDRRILMEKKIDIIVYFCFLFSIFNTLWFAFVFISLQKQ